MGTVSTRRRIAWAAVLVAASPGLAACNNDESEARTAAEGALHALGHYDGAGFCSYLTTKDNSRPLADDAAAFDECRRAIDDLENRDPDGQYRGLAQAKVNDVQVSDSSAKIPLTEVSGMSDAARTMMTQGNADHIALKKIDDRWYLLDH